MRYPACGFCGAPLIAGGRCPRCRYVKPSPSTVLSPNQITVGGGVASTLEYRALGKREVAGQSLSLSIAAPSNSLLLGYAVATSPTTLAEDFGTMTFGGAEMSPSNNGTIGFGLSLMFLLPIVNQKTASLVYTNNDSEAERLVVLVSAVLAGHEIDRAGHGDSGGGSSAAIAGSTALDIRTGNELGHAAVFVHGETTETGSWTGGMTAGQGIATTGSVPGYLSEGWKHLPSTGDSFIATKTLSVAREWYMDVTTVR